MSVNFGAMVNSILSKVSGIGAAVSSAAAAVSEVVDNGALFGEVADESAGLDTFNSASSADKANASNADDNYASAKDTYNAACEKIEECDTNIGTINNEISATTDRLNNLKALQAQASENSSSEEDVDTVSGASLFDYSAAISALEYELANLQAQLEQLEAEKEAAEVTKAEAEADMEKAETDGKKAVSASEKDAGSGNNTISESDNTEAKAEVEKAKENKEKESGEGGSNSGNQNSDKKAPGVNDITATDESTENTMLPEDESDNGITDNIPDDMNIFDNNTDEDEFLKEDIQKRIENNEITDFEMADYIINDTFDSESLIIDSSELVDLNASDAIETASEAYTTEMYSKTVYSNNVSTKTDTATVEENQEAIGDFMGAYGETASRVDAPNVEFLSLTDSSNWAGAQEFCARLNDGEYILTREIEKSTTVVESIEVASSQTEIQEEKTSKTKGEELLGDLEDVITNDETIADNDNDDVLTQSEYNEMENFFSDTDDVASYYEEMVKNAKKYGIYADKNAIAA